MKSLSKAKLKFFAALEGKKNREAEKLFLTEGVKVLAEGLRTGHVPHAVIVKEGEESRHSALLSQLNPEQLLSATSKDFDRLSSQVSGEGVIAAWAFPPNIRKSFEPDEPLPQTALLLEDVRDPGNLGTILRSADWFGIGAVICNSTTADCFNPKALRSSMGAIFRQKVIYLRDFLDFAGQHSARIAGTSLQGDSFTTSLLKDRSWVLLGNEANGISPALLQMPGISWVSIPGAGSAESLNVSVAAGILAWELSKI